MCLDGGPALYRDGDPRKPIHPGAELVTPKLGGHRVGLPWRPEADSAP